MKILLNILPEENKKKIQARKRFRFFLWQVFLILMLEFTYVIILGGTFFVLRFELQNITQVGMNRQSEESQSILLSYQQKFREMNTATEMIAKIDAQHFSFEKIFSSLDALVPDGMTIDHLSTKDYTIILSGKAKKREDLLTFENRLKTSSCVEKVNVPISNLFSQDNIDFQVDFDIKNECLIKK